MAFMSTITGVAVIDTRSRPGTITLPLTTQIPNRYLQIKDLYGSFGASSLTLSTQSGDRFDDGTTSKVFTDPFTFFTLYAASTTRWAQLGGTQTIQQNISSLIVSSITFGSGYGWLQLPPIQTVAVSTNTINADAIYANSTTSMYVSAQILYVSSIMGAVVGGNITTANLQSTIVGLGTFGYISTAGGAGNITTANLQSTIVGLGTFGYLSSISGATGFVSSLTVNALTVGTGSGWLQLPPLQTIYASTTILQGQSLYSLSSYFGTTSTATALQFWGLFGNYNNTVIAEVSTGAGTQELLMFKGSSSSDRVRIQTTGNFVVETGVSARLWDGTYVPTAANATPAFLITTSSNVGIQTSNPGAALDVNGVGRFLTVSTLALNLSSLNGGTVLNPTSLVSTVAGLGTAGYVSTVSLISTTGGLQTSLLSTTGGIYATTGTQLLSTTGGIYDTTGSQLLSTTGGLQMSLLSTTGGLETYISTFIDPTELQSTIVSTVIGTGQASNFVSTVVGLGTAGYLSSIPTRLSTAAFFTSSLVTSTITAISFSTQQIFTSSIFGNTSVFGTLSSMALFVSSFYTATRQATPMFVTF